MDDGLQIFAPGASMATGAASARIALPTASNSVKVKYVRVAALNACYVRIGDVTVVATNADTLIQPADCAILAVAGSTHIAAIQDAAAGRIQVSPVENN